MNLPSTEPRKHLHTRQIIFRCYLRDDNLWDIEGELADSKTYAYELFDRGTLKPGELIHGMTLRVTIDEELTVKNITGAMPYTPLPKCNLALPSLNAVIGLKMGPGWRVGVERAIGDIKGCTHLRELLFNMATAAYQTIAAYREYQLQLSDSRKPLAEPPLYLGKCISWALDSDATQKFLSQFSQTGNLADKKSSS